jgi:glycosyltransferase involved in cell wall biosynthesis
VSHISASNVGVPEVSVIVPAYNAQRYIAKTLESVAAQTLPAWEIIVVDDHSQDATVKIVEEFAARDSRIYIRKQARSGVSSARNAGLSAAHPAARAVMFLDADDVLEPSALETLWRSLRAEPTAVGAHGLARFIAADGRQVRAGEAEAWGRDRRAIVGNKIVDWPVTAPTTLAVLILLNRLRTPGCALLRREIVELVGGFDSRLALAEDYDLWLRMACQGDFAFIDDVVVSYRLHNQNASRNLREVQAACTRVQRSLVHAEALTDEQRQLIADGVRYSRLMGAHNWFTWARHSLHRRDIVSAARQVRHAVVELSHYCFDRNE